MRLVDVEVCDDGSGAGEPGPGHGLVGMAERAALYGGSVEVGNLPDGRGTGCTPAARRRDAAVTVRVLVVDDEELVRTGLRLILDAEPDLTVVGDGVRRRSRRSPRPVASAPTSS